MSEPFRILDLGAHDGFVSAWLIRKLKAQGVSVAVDGVELNEEAAATATRRIKEEGVEGNVVGGNALEAADYFNKHAYDAVICFELIEHVPETAKLLEVCELMLKPDGRIYVSTPDGTFGEGSNPHHLRALRAHDLADMLRRRGRLQDMTVGEDTVTVAAYTPAKREGEIAIYCGPGWTPWSPVDIEAKGLGGSETAAVRLAEALSESGYVITVYGEVEQCAFRDVIFRHYSTFDPTDRRVAVISSRIPEIFDRPVNARTRMLWLHDTDVGDRFNQRLAEPIDHVLTLSHWHAEHVGGMYPFVRPKIRQIRNGIHLPYFTSELDEPRAQRLVYTSSPDRGLDVLLELWPKIREQAPEAVFAYCYSDVYDAIAKQDPAIGEFRDRITELADQDGVQPLGALSQPELVRLMRTSMVWAHPSWASVHGERFFETSCIGAMEAQAAGCLAVASNWGALQETIRVGRLVNSEPGRKRWKDGLVTSIVEGLTLPEVQEWAQEEGPLQAPNWGWEGVAEQIVQLLDGEVEGFAPHAPQMVR